MHQTGQGQCITATTTPCPQLPPTFLRLVPLISRSYVQNRMPSSRAGRSFRLCPFLSCGVGRSRAVAAVGRSAAIGMPRLDRTANPARSMQAGSA